MRPVPVAYTWGRPTPNEEGAGSPNSLSQGPASTNSMPPVRWALACSLSRSGGPTGGEEGSLTAGCQRYFQQLLVVWVTDNQAPDIALLDQLLGPIDQFAAGDLDLLGPGVFVFHTGALYFWVLRSWSSPFALIVGSFRPP
jgi:hypothetical protein